jgi:hypothetical protein
MNWYKLSTKVPSVPIKNMLFLSPAVLADRDWHVTKEYLEVIINSTQFIKQNISQLYFFHIVALDISC